MTPPDIEAAATATEGRRRRRAGLSAADARRIAGFLRSALKISKRGDPFCNLDAKEYEAAVLRKAIGMALSDLDGKEGVNRG